MKSYTAIVLVMIFSVTLSSWSQDQLGGADRSNKSPFLEMPFYPQFSGFPLRSSYVNFQGFMSIFKGILLQVRKEKTKNLRTFTFSTGLRPLHDLTLD